MLRLPRLALTRALSVAFCLASATAVAQQTGRIEGSVLAGGAAVADIAVSATSSELPRARSSRTDQNGAFALPKLPPGNYRLTLSAPGYQPASVDAVVLLGQTTRLDVDLARAANDVEEVIVTAQRLVSGSGATLENAFAAETVAAVPLGQDYRDAVKLAPGVQFTQDAVRGPSAGGSGQDNVYRFDGVDVTLPMFGTLSAEPSLHDVEQVTFVRGGANAVGFNRSGGMLLDSTVRSGTDRFTGRIEYVAAPARLVGDRPANEVADNADESWLTVAAGGPLVRSRLYAYGSFYRPVAERGNKATVYGPVKDYSNVREEAYGRLTYAPVDNVLLNTSFRTSTRELAGVSIGPYEADSVSAGGRSEQDIASIDGSWLLAAGPRLSFRFSDYALRGAELPDVLLNEQPSLDGVLPVSRLDQVGLLRVPERMAGADAYNAAIAPIIERYGYVDANTGGHTGGGAVGAYPQLSEQSFYRQGLDIAVDHDLAWGGVGHRLHAGLRLATSRERLSRTSNGWGTVDVPGGVDLSADGTPVFYVATVQQMSLRQADGSVVAPIESSIETVSFELNDEIRFGAFTVNAGILLSQDVLYGQGLRRQGGTVSGFVLAPGEKYRMATIRWQDMIQPRLGFAWAYDPRGELFAGYARYNPAANSLARAASWDRNTRATVRVLFDESGHILEHEPLPGSSGKVFQSGLTPRRIDEWTVGVAHALTGNWGLRAHVRLREGAHFWEDTWNGSRGYDSAPADIAAKGLYVPELDAIRAEIGGSSYVIAELDGAYTRYWEAAFEVEWQGERGYLNASYVRSRYTGNFDQDNTSGVNDANRFIGSSSLADGYGRQLWDRKDGTLRGDRPHLLKVVGATTLPWRATLGAFGVYQSGQPWEAWDATAYGLPSYFSSTIRNAEPAGSRRSPSHWQIDLRYSQKLSLRERLDAVFRVDLFNVFDRQTGYNVNPYAQDAQFGLPRNRFDSRRLQLSFRIEV